MKAIKMSDEFLALCTFDRTILIFDCESMKITNRISNDVDYSALCFNEMSETLVVSDHGGFLMAMSFQDKFGDIEEEGISFKENKKK